MADEKNTVLVELYDLSITERTDDRFGRVITTRSMSEDDLINMAVNRRTDLNPTTLKASLEIMKDVAIECVLRGDSVRFGMGFFSLDVKGVFVGDNAGWDSSKHKLVVNVTPTSELREAVSAASVKVRGMAAVGSFINSVTDVSTGEVNTVLTAGGGVNITGTKIKIAGDKEENGLYLELADGEQIQIPMTSILQNDPSKISFVMPNVPDGECKLKVVTQFTSSNNILKEPRTYVFEYPLSIKGMPN